MPPAIHRYIINAFPVQRIIIYALAVHRNIISVPVVQKILSNQIRTHLGTLTYINKLVSQYLWTFLDHVHYHVLLQIKTVHSLAIMQMVSSWMQLTADLALHWTVKGHTKIWIYTPRNYSSFIMYTLGWEKMRRPSSICVNLSSRSWRTRLTRSVSWATGSVASSCSTSDWPMDEDMMNIQKSSLSG